MNPEMIYQFASAHPHCFLATCENSQPRVRGIHLYRADQYGLIFHTGKPKPLYQQLVVNRNVEFCFVQFNPLLQTRIWGKVEESNDTALKEEIVGQRQYLQPLVDAGGLDGLAVFTLRSGFGSSWSMENIMHPTEPVALFRP